MPDFLRMIIQACIWGVGFVLVGFVLPISLHKFIRWIFKDVLSEE